jgi:hypothetical protein
MVLSLAVTERMQHSPEPMICPLPMFVLSNPRSRDFSPVVDIVISFSFGVARK